jgi:hypothetical protein
MTFASSLESTSPRTVHAHRTSGPVPDRRRLPVRAEGL